MAPDPASAAIALAALAAWTASEVLIFRRHQAPRDARRDGGTLYPLILVVVAAVALAFGAGVLRIAPLPEAVAMPVRLAGLLLALLGIALRQWSVRTLDRHFTVQVQISHDHELITHGPYRHVRHPSYTGLLLTALGLGLAIGDAAAIALLAIVPFVALQPRLRVEEAVLADAFGDRWQAYAAGTRRLFPGLW